MKYRGTRLYKLVQSGRGSYTDLAEKMAKYRKVRKNSSDKPYRIESLYQDDHNITLSTLTALIKETGKPVDFFVDFEPWELSSKASVSLHDNIANKYATDEETERVNHLNEIIHLKDELLKEKERVISMKDTEIEQLKKRVDDLLLIAQGQNSDIKR